MLCFLLLLVTPVAAGPKQWRAGVLQGDHDAVLNIPDQQAPDLHVPDPEPPVTKYSRAYLNQLRNLAGPGTRARTWYGLQKAVYNRKRTQAIGEASRLRAFGDIARAERWEQLIRIADQERADAVMARSVAYWARREQQEQAFWNKQTCLDEHGFLASRRSSIEQQPSVSEPSDGSSEDWEPHYEPHELPTGDDGEMVLDLVDDEDWLPHRTS